MEKYRQINRQDSPVESKFLLCICSSNGNIVKETEAHSLVMLSMMSWWPVQNKFNIEKNNALSHTIYLHFHPGFLKKYKTVSRKI